MTLPDIKRIIIDGDTKYINNLVSRIEKLEQENKELKDETRQLRFRLADEQDEQNTVKLEWSKKYNKLRDGIQQWQTRLRSKAHLIEYTHQHIDDVLKQILDSVENEK